MASRKYVWILEVECLNQKRSIFVAISWFLDIMASHDMYSFMDGCNGYNQVKMIEENKEKIDFISKWGTYA